MLKCRNPPGFAWWRSEGAVMTDWEALKVKPFKLENVPAELQWCIYPEEQARGEVFLPETIYTIVLALRWILTYADHGLEEEFETWKVYWQSEGDYGFKTRIFLFREKVEQFNSWHDKYEVQQEQTWQQLAVLECNNGEGIVTNVYTALAQPYGNGLRLSGKMGVERLLIDAVKASQAMNGDTLHSKGSAHTAFRVHDSAWRDCSTNLRFEVVGETADDYRACSLKLEFWESRW